MYYPGISLDGLRKTTEILRIAGIRNEHLQNTSREQRYCCANPLGISKLH
jgi:hypothetical protein